MLRFNWLLVADTQQQVAALRRGLRAVQRRRWASPHVSLALMLLFVE